MSSTAALPLLLPTQPTKITNYAEWKPQRFVEPPQPPVVDDQRIHDLELAVQRQLLDGKALKKTRPRRTVDYAGGMGRWALFRKLQPNSRYVPYIRPSPPCIIDLLPPKAYPDNASTSLCTKFIHTSTNKIRCPVNAVTVLDARGPPILTGSTSGEFTAWNGLTFNFETILQAHDTAIRALTFNHAGTYIASADQSGIVKYFQPNMNNLTAWPAHREAVRGLSFSPDDERFATASDDSTRILTGHGWDVKCVEWHPTMGLLVSGSKDNLIKFWDPRTGTALTTLHQHKNTIQALAWAPHGNLLASASRDQTVRVFDIRSMKEWVILRGHKKEVCSLAWHPVHPLLVSGGSEDSSTRTLSQAHDSNVWALTFHPLGHLLVSASNDHTTRFWARERPGGAKPAAAQPDDDAYNDQDEDEYALAVPGFGSSAATASLSSSGLPTGALLLPGASGGAWWGGGSGGDGGGGGLVGPGGIGGIDSSSSGIIINSENENVVVPGFGGGGGGNGGGEVVPGLGSGGGGFANAAGNRQNGPIMSASSSSSLADGQGSRGGDDWGPYRRGGSSSSGGGGDGGGRGGGYDGGGRSGGFGGSGRGPRWNGPSGIRRGGRY
ncbi:WD40-repeat-containing domain protein [Lactifluus volemus]|nr:WD40-repeat-containing domain protein [Lactifluus volemus]